MVSFEVILVFGSVYVGNRCLFNNVELSNYRIDCRNCDCDLRQSRDFVSERLFPKAVNRLILLMIVPNDGKKHWIYIHPLRLGIIAAQ
jgi:hypothetical protein